MMASSPESYQDFLEMGVNQLEEYLAMMGMSCCQSFFCVRNELLPVHHSKGTPKIQLHLELL